MRNSCSSSRVTHCSERVCCYHDPPAGGLLRNLGYAGMAHLAYETLGLTSSASVADVKRAYHRKALHAHPDKGGDTAEFQAIAAAYETLMRQGQEKVCEQDNIVYLARCLPRMCLPRDHPLWCWSHETVFQYVCDTGMRDYADDFFCLPPDESDHVYTVFATGAELRALLPMFDHALETLFSFDPIRPRSWYAAVFVRM